MYGKSEFTLYKPFHEQEGASTIASRQPQKNHLNLKRAVLAQPRPRNPTLVLMLTPEISHQFDSIRLVWSARPPEVAAVHHSAIPVVPHQQETSGAGSENMPYNTGNSRPLQQEPVLHFLSRCRLFQFMPGYTRLRYRS